MNLVSYFNYALPSWWKLTCSRRPGSRIAILSTVWAHHAKRSGYHHLSDGLGLAIPASDFRLVPAGITRRVVGRELDAAYQIAVAMKLKRCDRLLVIDGDGQLQLVESIRRLARIKIYAVFHQVVRLLRECVADRPKTLLDGALCVARDQIPVVQSIVQPGKVWFLPHGIDIDYFSPLGPRSDLPQVLCVGWNYRDLDTLRDSANLIADVLPNASVRFVTPFLSAGSQLGCIKVISGLSDEELREEYRQAWVVLLPLIDSTANNSLLESMACGTPVVATDVGGVRDYLGPECGMLCPVGDARAHALATIELLLDPRRREAAGRAARIRAEMYAWPLIRRQVRVLFSDGE